MSSEQQPTETPATGAPLGDRISKPDEAPKQPDTAQKEEPETAEKGSDAPQEKSDAAPSSGTAEKDTEKNIPQTDGAPSALGGSDLHEPEYNVEVKLSDLQADPNNPLYSAKSFEELGLDKHILDGILAMNFRKPSKIQERALPLLLGNPPKNLVGQSQSGTGKTAAFVLNVLSRVDLSTEQMRRTPQALILAPTRELARQIVGVVEVMGQFMEGLVIGTAVPADTSNRPPKMDKPVVIGTPGTVLTLLRKRAMIPNHLKVLVLDEADNMLEQQGLGDQCIRVKAVLPSQIQVVLFSATFPAHVHRYASKFAPSANQITLQHEELTVEGIKQFYIDCSNGEDKYQTLIHLYGLLTVGSSIIFVNSRAAAAEIERRMVAEGHSVACLTAAIEGSQRDIVIDRFRSGEAKVLIATNVLARGIDVSTVSMVVNYEVPELHDPGQPRHADYQTYLHRIGRTGRFGRVGVAMTFVAAREEWDLLNQIQQFFNTAIEPINTRDWDEVERVVKKNIRQPKGNPSLR